MKKLFLYIRIFDGNFDLYTSPSIPSKGEGDFFSTSDGLFLNTFSHENEIVKFLEEYNISNVSQEFLYGEKYMTIFVQVCVSVNNSNTKEDLIDLESFI